MYRNRNSTHYNMRNFDIVVLVNYFWNVHHMRFVNDKRHIMRNLDYFHLLFATIATSSNNPSNWKVSVNFAFTEALLTYIWLCFFPFLSPPFLISTGLHPPPSIILCAEKRKLIITWWWYDRVSACKQSQLAPRTGHTRAVAIVKTSCW